MVIPVFEVDELSGYTRSAKLLHSNGEYALYRIKSKSYPIEDGWSRIWLGCRGMGMKTGAHWVRPLRKGGNE
jgi:hypothetical protein